MLTVLALMQPKQFDYIIVGGGTAGCVLAARLSEDKNVTVLMLEAGPAYRGLSIQIPASIGDLYRAGRLHWGFESEPEPHCAGRRLPYKLGRVLGGSSTINGQVWVRGNQADFDQWADQPGCENWSWSNVEPVFRQIESYDDASDATMGHAGPIAVTRGSTTARELNHAFLVASGQAGFPVIDNYQGDVQEGFTQMQRNVQAGRRSDVYAGYLQSVLKRPNLTVVTGATVRKLHLREQRAVGVEYELGPRASDRSGKRVSQHAEATILQADAKREVLLCAGALASPQLLTLSGIGPAATLDKLAINCVKNLPGIGAQLQTHPTVKLTFSCRKPVSLLRWTKAPGKWLAGLQWIFNKSGPATSNHFEMGGFMRSDPTLDRPDLQFTFVPLSLGELYGQSQQHGFEVYVVLVGGYSRGWTRIDSTDPHAAPRFCFNFLQDERDIKAMLSGCAMARKIVAQAAFSELLGAELSPGPDLILGDIWLRNNISVTHHLAGSCRMGPAADTQAVVGPDLKVHGIEGLRVVDASIMPRVTTGNTHAAVIMIAEQASTMIKQEYDNTGLENQ